MSKRFFFHVLPVAMTCAALTPAARGTVTFHGWDFPLGNPAYGISGDGLTIAGQGNQSVTHLAYRWNNLVGYQSLDDLPGGTTRSTAYAVNADGSIIGGGGQSASGTEAFRWTSGTGMQGLGDLTGGTFFSVAYGVSADGATIVGEGRSASGAEAFRWTSGTGMQGLGDLTGGSFLSIAHGASADGSTIVGYSTSASGSEAFRWTSAGGIEGLGDLIGGSFLSIARGVSGDGSTIVGQGRSDSGMEAFHWTSAGGMQGLGDLAGGGFQSVAYATSSDGSTVVGSGFTASGQQAMIWDATDGMRSLNDVLQDNGVNLTGWTLREARAISADGSTIAGWGIDSAGKQQAWLVGLTGTPHVPTWNADAGGEWQDNSNWFFIPGRDVDTKVHFTSAITSDRTVFTDEPITLGSILFDNNNSYHLTGAASLTLQVSSGSALVDVQQGTHKINLPLIIASDTELTVAPGATLKISDPVTVNAGKSLTQGGGGTVAYESTVTVQNGSSISFGDSSHLAALSLASDASASAAAGGDNRLKINNLSLAATARLDLNDNDLIIDYDDGDSPLAIVMNQIKSGFDNGTFDGNGITSSSAAGAGQRLGYAEASDLSLDLFSGQEVDETAVLVTLTFAGDTDLDGDVDLSDLGNLATHYGAIGGALWSAGDFDYDNDVDLSDLGTLATYYGSGEAQAYSDFQSLVAVPEPAGLGLLILAGQFLSRRSRRRA